MFAHKLKEIEETKSSKKSSNANDYYLNNKETITPFICGIREES
jgi:hypothetical protein